MKSGGIVFVTFLFVMIVNAVSYAQVDIECANGGCHVPSNVSATNLDLIDHTRIELNYTPDAVNILAPSGDTPRDFRAWIRSRTTQGQNLNLDIKSERNGAKAGNGVIIMDAIKNLSINSNGYNGNNHPSATQICASKVLAGDYGVAIRSAFITRRNNDPSLPANECDVNDLYNVQNNGQLQCDAGYVEIPTQNITGTRWEKKKVCTTQAGRALCVARRVNIRCDIYADKLPSYTGDRCCDSNPTPNVNPNWRCEPLRCSGNDSGWFQRFTFRMWEEEYQTMVKNGHSDQFICQTLTGAGGATDTIDKVDKTYVAVVSYHDATDDLTIYPPAGATVVTMQYSAGMCGSFSDDPTNPLDQFSSFFDSGSGFVRMEGEGVRKECTGLASDYSEGSYCRNALTAKENPDACTGTYSDYIEGNKCWYELLPTCTESEDYHDYENGSWCYNKQIDNCRDVPYGSYPTGSHCYDVLKERQCGGNASDYPAGHRCWEQLSTDTCSGVYTNYSNNSYCYNKLAPTCSAFDIPEGDPTPVDPDDPESEMIPWEHPLKNHPDYNFCMSSNNINRFPDTCPVGGNYTSFPRGSKCYEELQPSCAGSFDSYPEGSFCYEKNKPVCEGKYTDYTEGSFCWNHLVPETSCTEAYDTYPEGSYCYIKNIPVCTGTYTDYQFFDFCYMKLEPTCSGVYTDYPMYSDCWKKLLPVNPEDEASSCVGNWESWPAGSYCWKNLQPKCENTDYTTYPVGSFCYNKYHPDQNLELDSSANCAVVSGVGSVCWEQSLPVCGEIEEGNNEDLDFHQRPGQYCWYKNRAEENGFCEGDYSEYPKGSSCWSHGRGEVSLFYREPDNCSIRCSWNGNYSVCETGKPLFNVAHTEVSSTNQGQNIQRDALLSFKVRYKLLTDLGLEYNHDTEVKVRVQDPTMSIGP